MEWKFYSL